jgi:hypothetical protein
VYFWARQAVSDFSKKAMDGVLPLKVLEKRTSRKTHDVFFERLPDGPQNTPTAKSSTPPQSKKKASRA